MSVMHLPVVFIRRTGNWIHDLAIWASGKHHLNKKYCLWYCDFCIESNDDQFDIIQGLNPHRAPWNNGGLGKGWRRNKNLVYLLSGEFGRLYVIGFYFSRSGHFLLNSPRCVSASNKMRLDRQLLHPKITSYLQLKRKLLPWNRLLEGFCLLFAVWAVCSANAV